MIDIIMEAEGGSPLSPTQTRAPTRGREVHVSGVLWVIWLNLAEKFQGLRKGKSYNPGEQELKFRPQVSLLPVWNKHRAEVS